MLGAPVAVFPHVPLSNNDDRAGHYNAKGYVRARVYKPGTVEKLEEEEEEEVLGCQ